MRGVFDDTLLDEPESPEVPEQPGPSASAEGCHLLHVLLLFLVLYLFIFNYSSQTNYLKIYLTTAPTPNFAKFPALVELWL